MLQVPFIRQHTDLVKERLAIKNFTRLELVDELIELDDQRKKLQFEKDELLGKVNNISKEIGLMMKNGRRRLSRWCCMPGKREPMRSLT